MGVREMWSMRFPPPPDVPEVPQPAAAVMCGHDVCMDLGGPCRIAAARCEHTSCDHEACQPPPAEVPAHEEAPPEWPPDSALDAWQWFAEETARRQGIDIAPATVGGFLVHVHGALMCVVVGVEGVGELLACRPLWGSYVRRGRVCSVRSASTIDTRASEAVAVLALFDAFAAGPEMVAAEVLAAEQHAHEVTVDQRDHADEWADKLADAIAKMMGVEIGDHSNLNNPWANAFASVSPTNVGGVSPMCPACGWFRSLCACGGRGASGAVDPAPEMVAVMLPREMVERWGGDEGWLLGDALTLSTASRAAALRGQPEPTEHRPTYATGFGICWGCGEAWPCSGYSGGADRGQPEAGRR